MILGNLSGNAFIYWFCSESLSIVSLILRILRRKSSGKGPATAGSILSVLGLLLMIVFVVITQVSGPVIHTIQNQWLGYFRQ